MKSVETARYAASQERAKEKKKESLKKLAKLARNFVLAGVLGGTLGAGLRFGVIEQIGETKHQQQYERIEDLKKWTSSNLLPDFKKFEKLDDAQKEAFGDNFNWIGEKHRVRELANTPTEDYLVLNINEPWSKHETDNTERTVATAIQLEEGAIEGEDIQQILQETFPIGWVNNEVGAIRQSDETQHTHYQHLGGIKYKALASCYRQGVGKDKEKTEIVYHGDAKTEFTGNLIDSFSHEIAHANDWVSDNEMSTLERVNLLLKIYKRLKSPDRYLSYYVESIQGKDLKEQNYNRAVEYWAEISEQYFKDASRLHIDDFRLVDGHIRKTDPNFNWKTAMEKRNQIKSRIALRQIEAHGPALQEGSTKVWPIS